MLKGLVSAVALCAGAALLSTTANAAVVLQFDVGGGLQTITDGGAGDLNPNANAITAVIVGFGSAHISTGSATMPTGGPESIHLNFQNNAVPGGISGNIMVRVSATGFTTYDVPETFTSISQAAALLGTTATYRSWADDSNTAFGTACAIETGTTLTAGGTSDSTTSDCLVSGSYSLTQQFDIVLDTGALSQGAVNIEMSTDASVPEPATAALLGAGLLGVAGLRRRLRRKA